MQSRPKRLLAMAALMGLVMPVLFVMLSGTAEARCAGVNHEVTSTLEVNGTTFVLERPISGTCNNNNLYQGLFTSTRTGWRASVWIQNGGIWTGYLGGYDRQVYSYAYRDDNSHSYMSLCLDNGSTYYCGWGQNWVLGFSHAYYGVNYGF